jgi:serine/threonine-protein kinase
VVELKRAIALSPSLVEAYELLGSIVVEIDFAEGMRLLKFALGLDPSLSVARVTLSRAHAMLDEWEQAEALLANNTTLVSTARLRLGVWRRDAARLAAIVEAFASDDRRLFWLNRPIHEVARTGRLDGPAMTELCRNVDAPETPPRRRALGNQVRAELACHAGERALALSALSASVDAGLMDLSWIDRCPALAPLRADPKFAELRARVLERTRPVLAALTSV